MRAGPGEGVVLGAAATAGATALTRWHVSVSSQDRISNLWTTD